MTDHHNEIESTSSSKVDAPSDHKKNGEDDDLQTVGNSESGKKSTPILVIVAGVVLTILTVLCLQVDDWSRDWTHNSSETDPDATEIDLRPIESNLPPSELSELVRETMQKVSRWKVVESKAVGEDLVQIHLVHKTFFVGFKDDVHVEIAKTDSGSTLYAKSQSRIGKGDLGQNPRNIKELISTVRTKLQKQE